MAFTNFKIRFKQREWIILPAFSSVCMFFRRLIFLRNQQFVQTEVRLVPRTLPPPPPLSSQNTSGAVTGPEGGGDAYTVDCSFLDPHYIAALVAMILSPRALQRLLHEETVGARHGCLIALVRKGNKRRGAPNVIFRFHRPLVSCSCCNETAEYLWTRGSICCSSYTFHF